MANTVPLNGALMLSRSTLELLRFSIDLARSYRFKPLACKEGLFLREVSAT